MRVKYGVTLRLEFIPEGSSTGVCRDIYFKVFSKGTCQVKGLVLGWPTLDFPRVAGGEGLGWQNQEYGCHFSALRVTVPRLDLPRKEDYGISLARYQASGGEFFAIDEETGGGDTCRAIHEDAVLLLQATAVDAYRAPVAKLEKGNVGSFELKPGERAVVPVRWSGNLQNIEVCETHPRAPQGLVVLPGEGLRQEYMSLIVENESPLGVTVCEDDMIAIGSEIVEPSSEACKETLLAQKSFAKKLDWRGGAQDAAREIESPDPTKRIVLVIHKVPRFSSCEPSEIRELCRGEKMLTRISTILYENGQMEYLAEGCDAAVREILPFTRQNPWCGQTAFTFERKVRNVQAPAKSEPGRDALGGTNAAADGLTEGGSESNTT